MSSAQHYATAPEDRISLAHKVVYGFGAFVNNLLAAAIGGMAIVLNLGLGMNPALVGVLGALPRLTDALTDPLMGYVSDHTNTRWGRRRPYIFAGAIAAGSPSMCCSSVSVLAATNGSSPRAAAGTVTVVNDDSMIRVASIGPPLPAPA